MNDKNKNVKKSTKDTTNYAIKRIAEDSGKGLKFNPPKRKTK